MIQVKMIIIGLGMLVFGAACLAAPLVMPDESDVSDFWPFDGMLAIAGSVYLLSWSRKLGHEAEDIDNSDEDS